MTPSAVLVIAAGAALTALAVATVIVVAVLARRRLTRLHGLLAHLRRGEAPAWMAAGRMGMQRMSMRVLSIDDGVVNMWVPTSPQPTLEWSLPRGTRVIQGPVRVNARATVDGIHLIAPDGRVTEVALYPDPSAHVARPLGGHELLDAIARLSGALTR